jgi:GAF domain-containing protein
VIADSNREVAGRREIGREEAGLRRIATVVAEGVQPQELFAVVAEEVARVVDAPSVAVARYESDDTATVCGTFAAQAPLFHIGARVPLAGANVLGLIREHGEPARVDDYAELEGEIAAAVRSSGLRSSVGVPIVVAGRVWGAIVTWNTERLTDDTGARLAEFTELLAAAIANTEAGEALARIADEQAALRRVATLVAQGAAPAEIFAAVSAEVDHVFGLNPATLDIAVVARFDPPPELVVVGLSKQLEEVPLGSRFPPDELFAPTHVVRTRRSARIRARDVEAAEGEVAEYLRRLGYLSQVASPIVVETRLWGVIIVTTRNELPPDTEERLERFTDLVASAIANAESHEALAQLADEQAALRRVATLVAKEDLPERLFAKVAEETGRLFGGVECTLLRDEADGSATNVGTWGEKISAIFPLGTRFFPDGDGVAATVRRTGHPHRIDDYSAVADPIARSARDRGIESSVGCPIVARGAIWGAIVVGTTGAEPFPPETELRLTQFADLVAPAVANAEARREIVRLADEQAALRRIATLVARDAPPAEVFNAVAMEVGKLLDTDITVVGRYDSDGAATATGSWSASPGGVPVGTRSVLGGHNVLTLVAETEKPARVEVYDDASGEAAEIARDHGWRSSIGAPIIVEGRLWGGMLVATQRWEPFPAGAEERLAAFTDLVATALANAQAHDEVRRFGEEQAALGRVATLVAAGAAPEQVFAAVVDEASSLLGLERIELVHYEGGVGGTVIASSGDHPFPAGTTWSLDDPSVMATVARTGRAARVDDYTDLKGEIAQAARGAGFKSAIGAPITVEGRPWGAIIAISTDPKPIPERSEARLGQFTELIATAVANAEAREALAELAEEQAALRRVATLVAQGASPQDLFDAVAEEVGRLLLAANVSMGRYEPDDSITSMASWSSSGPVFPPGVRWQIKGTNVAWLVLQTGGPARIDDFSAATDPIGVAVREAGYKSAIGSPIVVKGDLWGVVSAASSVGPMPPGAEARLTSFTELVATALANAQAHDEVRLFGEEQAALGRVATLVAAGATPQQVFKSVVDEASSLLGLELVAVGRFDGEDTATIIAASAKYPVAPGTMWSLKDPSVIAMVAHTKRAARINDYSGLKGETARVARTQGFRSAIGAPLTIEGRLWGAIIAYSTDPEPIPEGSETRLGQFTELVATAVANAEARDALAQIADEQAALRRVATLVAEGVQPEAIFSAVGEEIGRLFGSTITAVGRFEPDAQTLVALAVGTGNTGIRVGSRWNLDDLLATAQVFHTGQSVRVDEVDWSAVRGALAPIADHLGVASTVASPIFVKGQLWGVVSVSDHKPLLHDAEERLEKFSELIATALANAESSFEITALAQEQAALRRVATLIAQGVPPEAIFSAVAAEIAGLFGSSVATVGRFESDAPTLVIMGVGAGGEVIPIGSRWELDPLLPSAQVLRSGLSVRADEMDWSKVGGPVARVGSSLGVVSTIASPIFIERRLWGAMTVSNDKQLPPDAEGRLEKFGELIATAIANAESQSELDASRRRIVTAADEARRRIERDLHDGIQQRLIALSFRARAMRRKSPAELPVIAAELAEGLKDASDELREIARGIHPTILTEAGLGPALRALARRSHVPIDVDVRLKGRLPTPVEAAAYYIASEALTNVAKHAHANVVELIAAHDNRVLTLEVRDDGIGGADTGRGSGILGLTDRVEALGGTITITSPPRGGTTLAVHLPITT